MGRGGAGEHRDSDPVINEIIDHMVDVAGRMRDDGYTVRDSLELFKEFGRQLLEHVNKLKGGQDPN